MTLLIDESPVPSFRDCKVICEILITVADLLLSVRKAAVLSGVHNRIARLHRPSVVSWSVRSKKLVYLTTVLSQQFHDKRVSG
jgi:hypothetical protein